MNFVTFLIYVSVIVLSDEDEPMSKASMKSVQTYKVFPLEANHKFRLVCVECLHPVVDTSFRVSYDIKIPPNHQCAQDILIVAKKNTQHSEWTKIRARIELKSATVKYPMCRYYTADVPTPCPAGETQCPFPHSKGEQIMWNLEMIGKFDISKFIEYNRNVNIIRNELEGTPCPLRLKFICGACWKNQNGKQREADGSGEFCNNPDTPHNWLSHRIVVVATLEKDSEKTVHIRPLSEEACSVPDNYAPHICYHIKQGSCKYGQECWFAHSKQEAHIWEWQARNRGKFHTTLSSVFLSVN